MRQWAIVKSFSQWKERRRIDKRVWANYLCLLNPDYPSHIEPYREAALLWRDDRALIRGYIEADDWRPNLIGNSLAILLRDPTYVDSLTESIKNESWVAPQLAAGVALISRTPHIPKLERMLVAAPTQTDDLDPFLLKPIVSAYMALKLLKSPEAQNFETTGVFKRLEEADSAWDRCMLITQRNWDFWRDIPPCTVES